MAYRKYVTRDCIIFKKKKKIEKYGVVRNQENLSDNMSS